MSTSGTFTFTLPNASVIAEAFERIAVPPHMVSRAMLLSGRISLNLELLSWSNETLNFWKITSGTIPLVAGQATYVLPTNMVTIEELYFSAVDATGTGVNIDRIMTPITRTQYASIVNKMQVGIPTQYWFQMLAPAPQITIWMVPEPGQAAPNYVLAWYGLQQMQDANPGSAETPDIHYRATDALCARLAVRLCEKFGPKDPQARQEMMQEKQATAAMAWAALQRRDHEPGPITFRPNMSPYAQLGVR